MWLIPSRRRLNKLRNFCNSACAAETTTPALIIVDAKDYKDNEKEYAQLEMHHFPNQDWKFAITEAEGMGPKIREVWPKLKDSTWVGVLNDDHFIITKHWDTKLVAQLTGKNFITCNDRWNAPQRAAGATIFSMPLLEAFGFPMFPPTIDHLGIDDVFEHIGRTTGCWEVDMSVIVEHHHVYKNPDMKDDTHLKVYGKEPWQDAQGKLSAEAQACQTAFSNWYQHEFPAVVQRVRAFRAKEQTNELPRRDGSFGTIPLST